MRAPLQAPALRRHSMLGLMVAVVLMPFAGLGVLISVIAAQGVLTGPRTDGDLAWVVAAWWSALVALLAAFGVLFARYGWASARAAHWNSASVIGLILLWAHALLLAVAAISGVLALLLPGSP